MKAEHINQDGVVHYYDKRGKMSLFKEINLSTEHAYQKALNLLDFCPQTEKMLSLKLIKKGYSQD